MVNDKSPYTTIDEYIAMFSPETAVILKKIRAVIKEAAPEATEKISYQMPTFYLNGNLVHFAAFKKHIGFFPTASGVMQFTDRLTDYKTSKGTIQFPIEKPIPYELISEIVKFRVFENNRIAEERTKAKNYGKSAVISGGVLKNDIGINDYRNGG